MADDDAPRPIRLMNFVSEDQILKENKDKKDAEFNERFKHRPPKTLDEDETEFLDKLDTDLQYYARLSVITILGWVNEEIDMIKI